MMANLVRRRRTDMSNYDRAALRTIGSGKLPRFARKKNIQLSQSNALLILWLLRQPNIQDLIDDGDLNPDRISEIRDAMGEILPT